MRSLSRIGICFLVCTANTAVAAPWKIDAAKSRLTFEAEQAGEPFTGEFKKFTPVIEFDPAHPERGTINVTIDIASITTEDKDRHEALPTDDWFAAKKFPTAKFTSTSISHDPVTKTDTGNYLAKGKLTIRGISKDITLPFSLKPMANHTLATGSLTLHRKDFGIGQGTWQSEEWVKNAVTVRFHLNASR